MARANRRPLFRLPRRADQQPGAERVSIPRPRSLASAVMSAQPKSTSAMDAHDETGRRVPPPAASPASLGECALRRQTPEVGAECPNWARSELSRGRSETNVPTGNGSMAGLCAPLSTLRRHPRGYRRMTRGQCGSLDLHCKRLALSTPCRSSRRTEILDFPMVYNDLLSNRMAVALTP